MWMAVIEDLLKKVSDPVLREQIAEEFQKLKSEKEYGLVFEEHSLESIPLYEIPVREGSSVALRSAENKETFIVLSVDGNMAHCISNADESHCDFCIDDIVVIAEADERVFPYLREIDRVCGSPESDVWHMLIEADNYHAMQMLKRMYKGKVDCIYIDPPYNTGARDWKYNNRFVDSSDSYPHSKWLSFMKHRLKLAEELLNPEDSALMVTIDEKEYLRLGLLLEQIFPDAKIQMVSSVINRHGTSRADELSRTNEFIYIVRFGNCGIQPLRNKTYISEGAGIHWQSFRRSNPANIRAVTSTQFYPIYVDIKTSTIKKIGDPLPKDMRVEDVEPMDGCETVLPIRDDGTEMMWGAVPKECRARLEKGYVRVGAHTPDKNQKYAISFLMSGTIKDIESGNIVIDGYNKDGSVKGHYVSVKKSLPTTQWALDSHDACDYGTKILNRLLPDRKFPYPKSLYAVEDCIRLFVANKPNALVLDFFAGSGTTAHAVMLLNHLDGGHRKSISITNNEVGIQDEKSFLKQGIRPGDTQWEARGIARYITWPRIKAAVTGVNTIGEPIKGNYKFNEEFPMSDGLAENAVYFKLGFLERGEDASGGNL